MVSPSILIVYVAVLVRLFCCGFTFSLAITYKAGICVEATEELPGVEAHVITEDISKGGGMVQGALEVKTRWYPVSSIVKLTYILQVPCDFKKQKR